MVRDIFNVRAMDNLSSLVAITLRHFSYDIFSCWIIVSTAATFDAKEIGATTAAPEYFNFYIFHVVIPCSFTKVITYSPTFARQICVLYLSVVY